MSDYAPKISRGVKRQRQSHKGDHERQPEIMSESNLAGRSTPGAKSAGKSEASLPQDHRCVSCFFYLSQGLAFNIHVRGSHKLGASRHLTKDNEPQVTHHSRGHPWPMLKSTVTLPSTVAALIFLRAGEHRTENV